jgi:hypothetical protein
MSRPALPKIGIELFDPSIVTSKRYMMFGRCTALT